MNMVKAKHQEKMDWLAKLAAFNPKNELKVATTINGKRIGRWIPFVDWLDISYVDHVTVLPNECIWEIDHENWDFVRKYAKDIIETLDLFEVPHVRGVTSGRGLHIHAYFYLPEHSVKKKLSDYGVMPRDVRLALFSMICAEAGIPQNLIGRGLPLDTGCVDFSDLGMGHMVRAFGGRKFQDGRVLGHKSMVAEVPKERKRVASFIDAAIPDRIVPYAIPKMIIEDLLGQIESKQQESLRKRDRLSSGMFLSAPCIKALLRDGRPEGDRYRGAQVVAIACKLSGLCYEAAVDVAREYYNACDRHDFSFSEVEGWLKWAYSREVAWWCSQAIPFRHCQPHICPVAEEHFSEKLREHGANPVWLRKWQRKPEMRWIQNRRKQES